MKVWFEDPQELIRVDKVLQFWPTNSQSGDERVNAASRFIIYAACFIYLIRRDPRIFVLASTVLGVLYVMYNSGMVKEAKERPSACYHSSVKRELDSTLNNRMKYTPGRSRTALPQYQVNAMARQFVSNPVTTAVGDQTGFAEWCYGKKFQPMCKSDTTFCNPDARGVQLEAFAGL